MSFVQTMTGFGESVPLPDAVTRAAIKLLGRADAAAACRAPKRRRPALCPRHGAVSDRAQHRRGQCPALRDPGGVLRSRARAAAQIFVLPLRRRHRHACRRGRTRAAGRAPNTPRLPTASAFSNSAAAGARCRCGWRGTIRRRGSPSVSNSHSQREFIAGQAKAEGLANLNVVTADMNAFQPQGRFDRVVSVEMFEHMANWRPLLQRMRDCLEPDGRMFMHVFANRHASYRFAADDKEDWIAQHYFTGGIMPSRDLIRQFPDCFAVDAEWRWNGRHYQRTAQHWLDNFDRNADAVFDVLKRVYGRDAKLWQRRWRLFFLATMGLFGHASRRGMGRQPLPADAGALTKSSARDQADREIGRRGGDAGGERAVADIEHGDLQGPIAQRRVVGQIVGRVSERPEQQRQRRRGRAAIAPAAPAARRRPRCRSETSDKTRSPARRAGFAPKCRRAPADTAAPPWWSATPRRSLRTRSTRPHRR